MTILLHFPCTQLRGIGAQMALRLEKLGIFSIQDLLFHLPFRYEDRSQVHPIMSLHPGEHKAIEVEIMSVSMPRVGKTRLLCQVRDKTGWLNLRFFYMSAAQQKQFMVGGKLRCFGEVRLTNRGLEMMHPEYRMISPDEAFPQQDVLTPIYPTTEGLRQQTLRNAIAQALKLVSQQKILPELLPAEILKKFNFPDLTTAILLVHQPPAGASIPQLMASQHPCQKRLIFEELVTQRLGLLQMKQNFQAHSAPALADSKILIKDFLKQLPFSLTKAQERVWQEIKYDLRQPYPMHRLLQGDVGAGKTVIAALAVILAIESGYQAVVMVPTELLAEQHYQNFKKWLEPLKVTVASLSSQQETKQKKNIQENIKSGHIQVLVGTHAVFQKQIEFACLSLVVIDEQHRFGVNQRLTLREKGVIANVHPHQLIMTATPIPRTLAMSVYADMDYSALDELPPGRTPVITVVVPNTRRDEILEKIQLACVEGKQAYWVCTLIEESEVLQCQAAENTFILLQQALPELKIGLLHGRMKSQEKDYIMQQFKQNEIQLLVATTVIEVGVDVQNASLMIIENAERLGLAQLHQLRGRVGRGEQASHCVLLYQAPLSQSAQARLSILRETNDGFLVAQRDLEIRGPGEVLGTRQAGEINLRIANLVRDSDLLPVVQQAADIILQEYPEQVPLLMQRWLAGAERYRHS